MRDFRLGGLSGRPQQHTHIVIGVGVTRINGLAHQWKFDCEVQPAVRLEDEAEVAVPVRLIGHAREAPLDECQSFVVPPLLMRKHTRVVQRAGSSRCSLASTRRYTSWASPDCCRFFAEGSRTRPPRRASTHA